MFIEIFSNFLFSFGINRWKGQLSFW